MIFPYLESSDIKQVAVLDNELQKLGLTLVDVHQFSKDHCLKLQESIVTTRTRSKKDFLVRQLVATNKPTIKLSSATATQSLLTTYM